MRLGEQLTCYTIHATELFEDEEFQEWLNGSVGKGLATWHTGGEPGEMSDIFVIYDHGEGDESPWSAGETGMPEKFWERIHELCKGRGITYGLLRLVNYEGGEE